MALTKVDKSVSSTPSIVDNGDATAITIDSSERVGIGTSTMNKNLNIHTSDSGSTNIVMTNSTTGTGSNDGFYMGIDSAENAEFWNYENTNMIFGVNNAERMRINDSGNLLIGRTDITRLGNGHIIRGSDSVIFSRDSSGETMQVCRNASAGDFIQFFSNNVEKGSIEYNGTNTLYNQSSDGRLKNITGKARGLEVINKLNPVAFNWKESGKADEGLIAQEVQEIFPNAVSNIEREYLQMDYSKLVTPLIKAIQELSAKVEELESKINE